MLVKRALATGLLVTMLAACQEESAPAAKTDASGQQVQAPTSIPASSSSVISVIPSAIQSCNKGIEATVSWDAGKAKSTTERTEIWVGADAASMKLFSAGGATGQTKTGPWTIPGTHFVLKNKQDGSPLGEAVVGGPGCN
jgi:hypothetical protein